MRLVLPVAWLTTLWVVLWRDASPANVTLGLVVSAVVVALFGPNPDAASAHRLRPVPLLRFAGYFAVKLVEANLVLAREVVTPRNDIETGIIAVPMDDCSDLVMTIVANAVSLTPGTLTVEVRRDEARVLYVHVLHLHDLDRARKDVRDMTDRVLRAVSPVDRPEKGATS